MISFWEITKFFLKLNILSSPIGIFLYHLLNAKMPLPAHHYPIVNNYHDLGVLYFLIPFMCLFLGIFFIINNSYKLRKINIALFTFILFIIFILVNYLTYPSFYTKINTYTYSPLYSIDGPVIFFSAIFSPFIINLIIATLIIFLIKINPKVNPSSSNLKNVINKPIYNIFNILFALTLPFLLIFYFFNY